MQGLGATAVSSAHVGACGDQVARHLDVVGKSRGVQRGVALVDLDAGLENEALVAAFQACKRQRGRRPEGRLIAERSPAAMLIISLRRSSVPAM